MLDQISGSVVLGTAGGRFQRDGTVGMDTMYMYVPRYLLRCGHASEAPRIFSRLLEAD